MTDEYYYYSWSVDFQAGLSVYFNDSQDLLGYYWEYPNFNELPVNIQNYINMYYYGETVELLEYFYSDMFYEDVYALYLSNYVVLIFDKNGTILYDYKSSKKALKKNKSNKPDKINYKAKFNNKART